MKKLIFACAIMSSCLAAPQLSAQDFCCAPQYDSCCDGGMFDGFYVGGNVGVASHTGHFNDRDGFFTDNGGFSVINTNVTAGVLLGYDWLCCNKLFGLVADWNWINTRHRHLDNPSVEGEDNALNHRAHWFTTIRARFGVTVCDALVYVTGGAAVARFRTRWINDPDFFSHRFTRWGWVGGVGTEFMLGCNWSLGAEVLFTHFSQRVRTFTSAGGLDFQFGQSHSFYVGRIILNYRFGDFFCCN